MKKIAYLFIPMCCLFGPKLTAQNITCEDIVNIRKAIANGTITGEKKKASIQLLGQISSVVDGIGGVTYTMLQTDSQDKAMEKYNELRKILESCKPVGWFTDEQDQEKISESSMFIISENKNQQGAAFGVTKWVTASNYRYEVIITFLK